jgi:hypothetical protein
MYFTIHNDTYQSRIQKERILKLSGEDGHSNLQSGVNKSMYINVKICHFVFRQ